MKPENHLKFFVLNSAAIEEGVLRVQRALDIDLGHKNKKLGSATDAFYPQFPEILRRQAESMSRQYQLFYCLENSIRLVIVSRLREKFGDDWWNQAVPPNVVRNAEENRKKELASGMSLRSTDMIDYVNFGELGEIIKFKWDIFGDMLRDIKAVEKILSNLNSLRAPIAHCNLLAGDEITRLQLALRDWFRQME